MSDEGTMEFSPEDKMAATWRIIIKTIIFLLVGSFLFCFSIGKMSGGGLYIVLFLASLFIAPGPMLLRVLSGGIGAIFATADNTKYYNVYADGRKERDHSTEATMAGAGAIIKFIGIVLLAIAGIVITLIYLVILGIKYYYYYRQVTPRPFFLITPLPIYAVSFILLIVFMWMGSQIAERGYAEEKKESAKMKEAFIADLPAYPFNATVNNNYTRLTKPSWTSDDLYATGMEDHQIILDYHSVITVIGRRADGNFDVEYEGQPFRLREDIILSLRNFKPVE